MTKDNNFCMLKYNTKALGREKNMSNEHLIKKKIGVCVYLCVCHIYTGIIQGQNRASDALELELKTFENCLIWVLGMELRCSRRTASA